jgi:hypothetical protein
LITDAISAALQRDSKGSREFRYAYHNDDQEYTDDSGYFWQSVYSGVLEASVASIPMSRDARLYATIRKDRRIRSPNAIQLACAGQARVDLFITNDERLSMKSIARIQFISSLQRAFCELSLGALQ